MTDERLNAAQRQIIDGRIAEAINGFMRDVNLRKWAVEQALTHCSRHSDFKELAKMFEAIYDFVSKPASAASAPPSVAPSESASFERTPTHFDP